MSDGSGRAPLQPRRIATGNAMKHYIRFPRAEGTHSRQAHADLPPGTFEREMSKDGFFGPAAHFHHKHPPTAWARFDGSLNPHAYDLNKLPATGSLPWDATLFMHNGDTRIRYWRSERAMDRLVRNQDGDELLFVHDGAGELYCDWGHLSYRDGDYVVIPRGGMWRIEPSAATTLLLIECTEGTFTLPEKGLVGAHAIFDPAMLDVPAMDEKFRAQQTDGPVDGGGQARGKMSTIDYPFNPLDAVGWHGDLCPVRLNVRDIRPLMSHRFICRHRRTRRSSGRNFVVCTFVPRPIESDPGRAQGPVLSQQRRLRRVIFYHRGDFFSRDNIKPGW
jgi:homogentisate 1,2-dioxygenase